MKIKTLELKNFRNYKDLRLNFTEGINIIYGSNAQGKTNILESIYVCATAKSHRTGKHKEMIRHGIEEAHVHVDIEKELTSHEIDVILRKRKKKSIAINNFPIRKMDDLLGTIHVVMFSPEDLALIKNGPKERRQFMNQELSQLDPIYYHYLYQYHKVLKQRNALLKEIKFKKDSGLVEQLDIWDMQLIKFGTKIIELREIFVKELNKINEKRHYEISGEKEKIHIEYEKNTGNEEFENKLIHAREKDVKYGTTYVGPHKDDLKFSLQGLDLRKYGSQGQHRTAALSLKLSEIELIQRKTQEKPILLLDDVLSELDEERQNYLMKNLNGIQTFITCTGIEDSIKKNPYNKEYYYVNKGEIEKTSF